MSKKSALSTGCTKKGLSSSSDAERASTSVVSSAIDALDRISLMQRPFLGLVHYW